MWIVRFSRPWVMGVWLRRRRRHGGRTEEGEVTVERTGTVVHEVGGMVLTSEVGEEEGVLVDEEILGRVFRLGNGGGEKDYRNQVLEGGEDLGGGGEGISEHPIATGCLKE